MCVCVCVCEPHLFQQILNFKRQNVAHTHTAAHENMNTCFYREVHPPTGVTAAVSGFFTHTPSALNPVPNLILARATEVDIYEVR